MKKIIIIILTTLALLYLVNALGYLHQFNQPLNQLVAGQINKSCELDTECVLETIDCGSCRCATPVNKNWQKFCPFKDQQFVNHYCAACRDSGYGEPKCINHECREIQN